VVPGGSLDLSAKWLEAKRNTTLYTVLFFFCGTGVSTQGFVLAKLHSTASHTSRPFSIFLWLFWRWGHVSYLPRLG
jgi:hypothetical protein